MLNGLVKKSLVFLFVFTLAAPIAAENAEAVELGVEADYWITKLEGTVKSDTAILPGDEINLKDDLGMKDENIIGGKLYLQGGKHRLTLRYTPLKYEGSKTKTTTVDFHGQIFDANAKIDSELVLNQLDVQYTYWLLNMKTGARLGLVGAVKNVSAKATLKGQVLSVTTEESESISVPIPMLGLSAELGIGDLVRVTATGVGIAYSGNSLFDVTAAIEVSPVPLLGISAGFRGIYLNVESGDAEVKVDTTGAFIGVFAHF
jgi:outer membrane protein